MNDNCERFHKTMLDLLIHSIRRAVVLIGMGGWCVRDRLSAFL